MKQLSKQIYQKVHIGRELFTIVVFLMLILGASSAPINAESITSPASFNNLLFVSGDHNNQGKRLEELLDGIVDFDEIVASALGITVDELEAARAAGTSLDELIDKLGLDADTVHQAIQDALEAAVEQAVEDGLLTEEEAEAILNPPTQPDFHQSKRLEELLDGIVDFDEIVASALGITVDELEAARAAGTSLDELIDKLGLDADTVHQAIQDALEAAVEQAVEDGLLTEEEAEAILNPPAPSHDNMPPNGSENGSTFSSPPPGVDNHQGNMPPSDNNGDNSTGMAPDEGSNNTANNNGGNNAAPERGHQDNGSQGGGENRGGGSQGGGENRGGKH